MSSEVATFSFPAKVTVPTSVNGPSTIVIDGFTRPSPFGPGFRSVAADEIFDCANPRRR